MAHIPRKKSLLENARTLRRTMTPQERHLWYDFLKTYPIKCYRQRIMDHFIVDFYCARAKLVIELDGSQHTDTDALAYDAERTAVLNQLGISVIRFPNNQINRDFDAVCAMIDLKIKERMGIER